LAAQPCLMLGPYGTVAGLEEMPSRTYRAAKAHALAIIMLPPEGLDGPWCRSQSATEIASTPAESIGRI